MRTTRDTAGDGTERVVKAALAELPLSGAIDRFRVGADRMARFGDVADADVVITESDLDDDTTAGIAFRGPRVVRA